MFEIVNLHWKLQYCSVLLNPKRIFRSHRIPAKDVLLFAHQAAESADKALKFKNQNTLPSLMLPDDVDHISDGRPVLVVGDGHDWPCTRIEIDAAWKSDCNGAGGWTSLNFMENMLVSSHAG